MGDGSKVNIFADPWLTDKHGMSVQTTDNSLVSLVSELNDNNAKEWNFEVITSPFNERDTACILVIPISIRNPVDCLTWAYSNHDLYSV